MNLIPSLLGAASLVAVMARTMLTFRDNVKMLRASREEAQTDALTGLANRRALARMLERELAEATPDDPLVLVLFDLDGFKHYNDTFGHPAGDALLVRLGGEPVPLPATDAARRSAWAATSSARCSRRTASSASRWSPAPPPRCPSTARASTIGCSYGAIELPTEARDVAEALRIADQRMYAQKNAGRMSASRQTKDVLLSALAERNPELRVHLGGVADLAEATAARPAARHDEVEQVRHAAELHDVGKVAIPDAILIKPGAARRRRVGLHPPAHADRRADRRPPRPRSRGSRRSSARATSAGTAPAIPTAWPASEIPLGARIIAVADAFHAMTSPRPYTIAAHAGRGGRGAACAAPATQFDPGSSRRSPRSGAA